MLHKVKKFIFHCFHPVIGEVWQLHRVTNKHARQERLRLFEITPGRLDSAICDYLKMGYEFIPISEVPDRMSAKKTSPFICITLDDGYADNFDVAYPIFKKYNVPFCIYVCERMITEALKENDSESFKMLTINQIQSLDRDPLCTIGSHTRSHLWLSQLSRAHQMEEIVGCKNWLEGLLGRPVEDFAFPYGDFNDETVDILQHLNISTAVAAWGGPVLKHSKEGVLKIPRLLVTETAIN